MTIVIDQDVSQHSATPIGLSRRGLVRAGAIALGAVPIAAISGKLNMSSAPLEGASFAEWSQRRGGLLLLLGESGPIPAIVTSVTALEAPGARPASLPRAFAFEVVLETDIAAAPSGNATYEAWLGPVRSSLFLVRRAGANGKAVFSAVFN